MEKFLTLSNKNDIAKKYGIDYAVLCAVIDVESSGSGFDKSTGLIKIQFEPYEFKKHTHIDIVNGVELQAKEWEAFNKAFNINPEEALCATSWGLGQIMGFNHHAAGYDSAKEMVDAFKESEYNQLCGMINFIKSIPSMFDSLMARDFDTFARYYNGINYKKFDYANRLRTATNKYNHN